MFRSIFLVGVLAISLPVSLAQVELHGVPATVTAPGPNGQSRGIPSSVTAPDTHGRLRGVSPSVTSPAPAIFHNTFVPHRVAFFGDPHHVDPHHKKHDFVPIPVFYPVYQYPVGDSGAQQEQPADDQSAGAGSADDQQSLQDAYNRGVQDALSQQGRYGQHYLDSRERGQSAPPKNEEALKPGASTGTPQKAAPEPEDDSPATVFIFKDGQRLETKNFVIMGETLFDFSSKPLKKIQIADLDVPATRKANDDLGNSLKLP